MKKTLLLIFLSLSVFSVKAQPIPNADFENWNNFTFDDANEWFTSNTWTVPEFSIPTVSPVGGFSVLAARIETFIVGLDTLTGYLANTTGDPLLAEGGVPYSEQPTDFTGYYRYELPGDDTALILVIFKNGGLVISSDLIQIKGTGSELNFVAFSYPLSLASMPDTVIIAATSSNLISGQGISSGSWIELDELAFTGPSITQPIPGGTFDNWTNRNLYNPLGWTTFGDGVSQSNDASSGTSALGLETIDRGSGPESSGASTGQSFSMGGQPYTNTSDTLYGMFKYQTALPDTALINISTTLNGLLIGGGYQLFLPTSVYTPFAIPFSSPINPDSMRIDILSSYSDSAKGGSLFLVDNLQLYSIITGINENPGNAERFFSAYPNPVHDKLNIVYQGQTESLEVLLYNSLGELIYSSVNGMNKTELNMGNYPAGTYWLKMISPEKVNVRKIIKQ